MLRLLGILVTVVFAIGAAVLTWPSFFQVGQMAPVVQIVSFRGLALIGFGAVVVLALLLAIARPVRGFALSIAVVAGAAVLANGITMAGRGLGTESLPDKTADSIRVMTWNTAGQATPADSIARIAVAMDADIVALPETTIEAGAAVAVAMRELGHPMWAHHTEYGPEGWGAALSTTLLISPDLGDYSVIASSQDGSSNTSTVPSAVAMPVSGDGPIVVAAHAVAPRQSYMQNWRDDLRWLADQCGEDNVILAGDFNATIDHMGSLGVDGGTLGKCVDSAAETGNGSVGTWSTDFAPLLGAPIDHVMASSKWKATGSLVLRSATDSQSDHRPLIVQLEPAG